MKYELALVLSPLTNDDVKNKVLPRIEKAVTTLGGKVGKYNFVGKRILAYAINKQKEGYYVFGKLELESKNALKFDAQLKRMPEMLRFMRIEESTL